MKDKGVLFTAGLALLAYAVLSFASMAVSYRQEMNDVTYQEALAERLFSDSESAEADLKDLLTNMSGIGVSVSGSQVTFKEQLPNGNADTFKEGLTNYVRFKHTQSKNLALNVDELKNTLTLSISPSDVNYTHNTYGGREIRINPSTSVSKYLVAAQTNATIDRCEVNNPSVGSSMVLDVRVDGNSSSCYRILDVNTTETVSVSVNSGSIGVSTLPGGRLLVSNNLQNPINVSATVYLIDATEDIISVNIADGIVRASFPEYGLVKTRGVRLN